MVSKRQKVARKRFKEEHPELFPKTEPTPPKKKKNSSKFKRNKSQSPNNSKISLHRKKHPLRIPGMRPGDSCFICKATDHIAKNCPQKAMWEKNKICLFCRQRGHSLKNCSKKSEDLTDNKKFCYNCGEAGHSLANCPQPLQDGGTRFANCFICNEQGHLSKNCPQNTHGIYPKGGCCKICGGITHLAKDCPNKSSKASYAVAVAGRASEIEERPRRPQVTRFTSGDDPEDDFMTGVRISENEDGALESKSPAPDSKRNVKLKTEQGRKVVNFVG